jgi:hypothetical protein
VALFQAIAPLAAAVTQRLFITEPIPSRVQMLRTQVPHCALQRQAAKTSAGRAAPSRVAPWTSSSVRALHRHTYTVAKPHFFACRFFNVNANYSQLKSASWVKKFIRSPRDGQRCGAAAAKRP